MASLVIKFADLASEPIGSGQDVSAEVLVSYTREVPLTDGTVLQAVPTRKLLGAGGTATFEVTPSDDPTVQADFRGFGLRIEWLLTHRAGRGRQTETRGSRTVKVLAADGATVQFGTLLPAEPLPPQYVTAAEVIGDFDSRVEILEGAAGLTQGTNPVLTDVTEIPTDIAGRIDLVYTQPTTVHFDSPGLTDIVLSIEGYEHVTWSGVVVHGTPDQSGVVWASAMWRDRDSTWHLLCEQDASQGGGLTMTRHTFPIHNYQPVEDGSGGYVTDASGKVEHALGSHPIGAEGHMSLVTATIGNGDSVIVDTSHTPDENYPSVTSFFLQQSVIQQTPDGLGTGFIFMPEEMQLTAGGVRLLAQVVVSQDPLVGIASQSTTFAIPIETIPPIGYADTGSPTNSSRGEGLLDLPGGAQFGVQVNNSESGPQGIICGFHDLDDHPIPVVDANDPDNPYASLGYHTVVMDTVIPYTYFSMTTPA